MKDERSERRSLLVTSAVLWLIGSGIMLALALWGK
jgi:hypothetical protein